MSSGPSSQVWSYVPFANRPRRRSSVAISNNRSYAADPFEKPDRHRTLPTDSMQEKFSAALMNQGQRARYLKTGCIVGLVLFLIYLFAPSSGTIDTHGFSSGEGGAHGVISETGATKPRCTKSFYKDKPLIQYALMIDAGSTGSRIHVYRFNNCGPTPELENEIFKQTPKKDGGSGLSSYKTDAEGAAKSLDVLMDEAVKAVPDDMKSCTPVAVKATAGLRKLGKQMSDEILKAVRTRLETAYPFPVVDEAHGGVEVMDGKYEGVYAWITTNYLLGKLSRPGDSPTAAVFDLGGGSTQIVFQPTFAKATNGGMPEVMEEGDHKYKLTFGGHKFELYQHSYLGYGLMEARNNLHRVVIEGMHKNNPDSKAWMSKPITNPCLAPNTSREIVVSLEAGHPLGAEMTVNMTGPTIGSPAQCRGLAEKTLKKESECKLAPCAFNSVYQPSLAKTFSREDVYLLSFFYDRARPLGMPDSFTLREFSELAARVCRGGESWNTFRHLPDIEKELEGRPEACLDLSFMMALLHTGYEIPLDREVKIAKKINDNELGWALGAALPLLSHGSGWTCRIKEVV